MAELPEKQQQKPVIYSKPSILSAIKPGSSQLSMREKVVLNPVGSDFKPDLQPPLDSVNLEDIEK